MGATSFTTIDKPPYVLYWITNTVNDKVYVGYTNNLAKRFTKHKCKSLWNRQPRSHLYNSMRKYGAENFHIKELEQHETLESVQQAEIEVIALFRKHTPEIVLNITDGGEGSRGFKMSQEQKDKVSKRHKGKTISIEQRKAMSDFMNYKMKNTDEYKQRMKRRSVSMRANNHNDSRIYKVIDQDGIIYNGLKEAATLTGCDRSDIGRQVRGIRKTLIKNKYFFRKVI